MSEHTQLHVVLDDSTAGMEVSLHDDRGEVCRMMLSDDKKAIEYATRLAIRFNSHDRLVAVGKKLLDWAERATTPESRLPFYLELRTAVSLAEGKETK